MEFKKLIKEWDRMCDSYSCEKCKIKCEIHKNPTNEMEYCEEWIMKNPAQAEEIISEWAKEHPVRTYLADLLEKYPNTPLRGDGTPIEICPEYLGLKNITRCNYNTSCKVCWNQEMPL